MDGSTRLKTKTTVLSFFLCLLLITACKRNTQQADVPVTYHYHHELKLPEGGINNATPTLILLHGYGSNELDLFANAKHFDPSMLVVCPRAPIVLAENKYSWYPLNRTPTSWSYDEQAMLQTCDQVLSYIDQLIKDKGVDPDKIFLGGFSQGAIMSLGVGLQYPERIAGIISLSGQLYPELQPRIASTKDLKKTKLFISHGLQDAVLPVQPIKTAANDLKAKGLDVSEHYYNIAHSINSEGFGELLKWLLKEINE